MKIELYNNTDEPNVIDKKLIKVRDLNVTFRQVVNEKEPVLIMQNTNINGCNYVYIDDFKRYYFISDITNFNNVLSKVTLTTDLLMTYKNVILNNDVIITATSKPSYLSSSLPTTEHIEVDRYTSDFTLPDGKTMILTTIGG